MGPFDDLVPQQGAAQAAEPIADPTRRKTAPIIQGRPDPYKQAADQRATDAAARDADRESDRSAMDNIKRQLEEIRLQNEMARQNATGGVDTTGDEKTAAFLTTRIVNAQKAISRALKKSDGADRPGILETVAGAFGEDARGLAQSPQRQQTYAAYLDLVDAALTLGTGAAYTAEQKASIGRTLSPQLSDTPDVIEDKRRRLLEYIEAGRIKSGAANVSIDKAVAAVNAAYGAHLSDQPDQDKSTNPLATGIVGGGDAPPAPVELATTAGTDRFATEQDKRFAALAQRMFDDGASREELDELSVRMSGKPFGPELDAALQYRDKGGKGARIEPGESGSREISELQGVAGSVATSPAFAAGAGALNVGGLLDEASGAIESAATGRPIGEAIEEADLKKQAIRNARPYSFGAGEIAGNTLASVYGSRGLGSAIASRFPGVAARFAPTGGTLSPGAVGTDFTLGAVYGAGEENQDRVGGATRGGGSAIIGGVLGRGAVNRVAGAIAPEVSENVRFLRDKGVRTSPGQSIGRVASKTEEKLTSIPGVGDLMAAARNRAADDFNIGYLNEGLSHIGKRIPEGTKAGPKAMAFAQKAFDDAYDEARAGMTLAGDQQLVNDLTALDRQLKDGGLSAPDYKRLRQIYNNQVARRMSSGGRVSGDNFKKMMSFLGKKEDLFKRQGQYELADAMGELKAALDAAARRSSPPEAAAKMDAADAGYALQVRAENAARMAGGDMATFTPAQLDSAVRRADSSVRSRAYLRGDALGQKWAEAGKDVLGDRVANSGSVDRGLAGTAVLGGAYLEPTTLLGAGGLAAAYAPGARDIVSSYFAGRRSPQVQGIADKLRDKARLIGVGTAPLALTYQSNQ